MFDVFDGKTLPPVRRLPRSGRDRSQLIVGGSLVRHFWGQSRPIKITCYRMRGELSVAGARMPCSTDRRARVGVGMQIRLTVVDPLGPAPQRGRAASRDVLVTAPTGTDLAA